VVKLRRVLWFGSTVQPFPCYLGVLAVQTHHILLDGSEVGEVGSRSMQGCLQDNSGPPRRLLPEVREAVREKVQVLKPGSLCCLL
jgi:hypothetical protein